VHLSAHSICVPSCPTSLPKNAADSTDFTDTKNIVISEIRGIHDVFLFQIAALQDSSNVAFDCVAAAVGFEHNRALIKCKKGSCVVLFQASRDFPRGMTKRVVPSCGHNRPARFYAIQECIGCS
jgi:hypothetical protein